MPRLKWRILLILSFCMLFLMLGHLFTYKPALQDIPNNMDKASIAKVTDTVPILYYSHYILPRNESVFDFYLTALKHCYDTSTMNLYLTDAKGGKKRFPLNPTPLLDGCPETWNSKCLWNSVVYHTSIQYSSQLLPKLEISKNSKVQATSLNFPSPGKTSERVELAVCIGPLSYFVDWTQIVQFVEIWLQLGANHFYFYVNSISREVQTVVRIYVNDQVAEVVPWPPPSDKGHLKVSSHVGLGGKNLAFNDCLFRARHRGMKFAAFPDLDEVFVMKNGGNLVHFLQKCTLELPKTGAFTFDNTDVTPVKVPQYISQSEIPIHEFSLEYMAEVIKEPPVAPGKLVVLTRYVHALHVHNVQKFSGQLYQHHLNADSASVYHIRRYLEGRLKGDSLGKQKLESTTLKNISILATKAWRQRALNHYPEYLLFSLNRPDVLKQAEQCSAYSYKHLNQECFSEFKCDRFFDSKFINDLVKFSDDGVWKFVRAM